MKSRCALCGRLTEPAVMIGPMAVGPRCARKANLMPAKMPKGANVRFLKAKRSPRAKEPETLDLFAEVEP